MIVIYGSFRVDAADRPVFDAWYRGHLDIARREKGCIAYEYLLDPLHPERGYNVEIWETRDDFQAHMLHPDHVVMMAEGSSKWGIRDLQTHFWMDAEGHDFNVRDRLEEPVEGRGDLYEQMAALQAANRQGGARRG